MYVYKYKCTIFSSSQSRVSELTDGLSVFFLLFLVLQHSVLLPHLSAQFIFHFRHGWTGTGPALWHVILSITRFCLYSLYKHNTPDWICNYIELYRIVARKNLKTYFSFLLSHMLCNICFSWSLLFLPGACEKMCKSLGTKTQARFQEQDPNSINCQTWFLVNFVL